MIVAAVSAYLALFLLVGKLVWTGDETISFPVLLMRALGTCAFLMLHVVLAIGPLARLERRFLPLVYNRIWEDWDDLPVLKVTGATP